MTHVKVLLFGVAARTLGRSQLELELDLPQAAPTCSDIRQAAAAAAPHLASWLAICRFAVNHTFVGEATAVGPRDEVALIGMVSGG